jgi:hypothetical protein
VRETSSGWGIIGEDATLTIILLSDTGFRKLDTWSFDRNRGEPINRISWRDAFDREHTVQVALLSFQQPKVSCDISDQGIQIHIESQVYLFRKYKERLHLEFQRVEHAS